MIRRAAAVAALILVASTGLPSASPAYEIYPKHPVHETMTRLSYRCLQAAGGGDPGRCGASLDQIRAESRWRLFRRFTVEEKAATWPDDPQREINPFTAVRFGASVAGACAREAPDRSQAAFTLSEGGLTCSSHWGSLQFLHAMRSAEGEATEATRRRVLDWAEFAYATATGRIDPETDYCRYFRDHPSSISADLAPSGFSGCEERTVGGRSRPAWRIATLFTLRCGNPFSGRFCSERLGDGGAEETRRVAMGALLHLIQDSYSQSHVVRGSESPTGFRAEIVCARPTRFHFYSRETSGPHGRADKPPSVATNCRGESGSDDPITAGAAVLWMARSGAPPARVRSYLERRVFGAATSD